LTQRFWLTADVLISPLSQELAGHADLRTTMRCEHVGTGSKEAAIAVVHHPEFT
jgi:hypothetical protein